MGRAHESQPGATTKEGPPSIDTIAEALLHMAIRHEALTPQEAQSLAIWDLTTIAEFLALRLENTGLLTADECRSLLGDRDQPTH